MLSTFINQVKPAFLMLFWMTLLTGLAYPLAMTSFDKALFPVQAEGSLMAGKDSPAGSSLIGQPFASDRYFQGRPSATTPHEYNAGSSSGSNLGPSNKELAETVTRRSAKLKAVHGDGPVPMDLVTASGSGLDPHISPKAATYQLDVVAKARNLPREAVAALLDKHTETRLWDFWGEPRVNVLALNLALDSMAHKE